MRVYTYLRLECSLVAKLGPECTITHVHALDLLTTEPPVVQGRERFASVRNRVEFDKDMALME